MPGTLGTMKMMLNPSFVIAEQSYDQGATAGRVADLGPALARWSQKPLFGRGFGTTVADPNAAKESDAQILDNQWLGSLLEIGAFGAAPAAGAVDHRDPPAQPLGERVRDPGDGWLATALAASIIAFATGMLTFDAFAFIQVTFFVFVMLGFAAVVTRWPAGDQRPSAAP